MPWSSENDAISYPSIVIENLAAVIASPSATTCHLPSVARMNVSMVRLLLEAGAAGELADPEDHELRGLHRCDADLHSEDAGVAVLGRVVLLVALDEERLVGGAPEEG